MNQKTDQLNTIVIIFIVLFVSITIFFTIFYKFEQSRLYEIKEQYYTKIESSFQNNVQKHLKEHYLEQLENFVDEEVIQFMALKDRKGLHEKVQNRYEQFLNEDQYFQVLHFHQADGKTLLRMHNTELFGDDIASQRPLVASVQQKGKTVYGFDVGLHGFMYRIVQPFFYEGEYIGAVEIGVSTTKILDLVTFFNKIDGVIQFFIDDSEAVVFEKVSDRSLLEAYPQDVNLPKSMDMKVDEKYYVVYSFDISNHSGEYVGEFIFFDDLTNYYEKFYDAIIKMAAVSVISLLVLFFLFRFLLQQHSQKLSKLHNRTNAVLNAQNDIVIVSTGEKIIEANYAFLEFMGYESLQKFHQNHNCICDLFEKQEGYISATMDGVLWSQYLLENNDKNNVAKIVKDNEEYIFRLHAKEFTSEDEFVITMADITQIIQKDAQIQKVKERLELTIEATKTGLWDWNLCSNDITWDKNAYEMLGYEKDAFALNLKQFLPLMHKEDLQMTMQTIDKSIKESSTFVVEFRMQKKDGSWVWIEGRGKSIEIDQNGEPVRMVGTHIDITKRKEQEMELERLNKHLQDEVAKQVQQITSKDKLLQEQAKLAAMGEMIGAIAHQWRQPLNALSINIQNLDDDFEDGLIDEEFINDFIQKQISTIGFMSKTIDDFRNFFKADKRKTIFSVKKVIKSVEHLVAAQLKNYSIEILIEGEDFELEGYQSEMKQVVLNLISNSKDAINKTAKSGTIRVVLDAVNKKVFIKDSGGGVDEAILERIFEPYFTTKEHGKGTGIGLYMSKTIVVEHMNGKMYGYNEDDGLCMVIEF